MLKLILGEAMLQLRLQGGILIARHGIKVFLTRGAVQDFSESGEKETDPPLLC